LDSVWLPDAQAKNNYEGRRETELALKLGREIATPAEAWESLAARSAQERPDRDLQSAKGAAPWRETICKEKSPS